MMPNKCTHPDCGFNVYDGGNKCIFHCEKDNFSSQDSQIFWQNIEDKLKNTDPDELIDFRNFVFPVGDNQCIFSTKESKNIKNEIKFDGAVFLGNVTFQNFNFENFLNLNNVSFEGEAKFTECNFEKVEFHLAKFCKNLIFTQCSFKNKFTIGDPHHRPVLEINYSDISGSFDCILTKFTTQHENLGLQAIKIVGLNVNDKATCRFDLLGTSIDELTIDNSISLGLFHLANIAILKSFNLDKSIFSKNCLFDNIRLDKADKTFKELFFSEATFINIEWGNKADITADREHFRQLKYAYDKQANYIEANEFYALEMREYQKELSKKYICIGDKITSPDWLVFTSGWFASNHSQSWLLPLFWMFTFSIGFYGAAVYCSGLEQSFDCYLRFANPFSTRYECSNGLGWWILNKSFFAFFAYHFIVSLRRNTKR